MEENTIDKGFRIERPTNSNTRKMKNTVNIKTDDNVNIKRNDENIHLTQSSLNQHVNQTSKPQLTRDQQIDKVKPKLSVPMDGLDLLSNSRNKLGIESSINNTDSDSIVSDYSSDSDNVKNSYNDNFFSVPKDDDSSDDGRRNNDFKDDSKKNRRDNSDSDSISSTSSSENINIPRHKTYEEIQREKQFLLYKLERLEKQMKIKLSRRFTIASNIEDIKSEYDKLKRERDVDKSITLQRRILMGVSSAMEYLNKRYDPIDAKLDGWSESIMEGIDDYDEVFEELHDKYSEKIQIAPEIKLLMMVGGSAFMFHLTNTLFKSNTPSLNEVLKQNPDIMREISKAAANTMNNSVRNDKDDPLENIIRDGVNMKAQQYDRAYQKKRPQQYGNKMHQPIGVDDVLSQLGGNHRRNTMNNLSSASDTESVHSSKSYSMSNNKRRDKRNRQMGININT